MGYIYLTNLHCLLSVLYQATHQILRILVLLAHLSTWLIVSYCDCASCFVCRASSLTRRQILIQMTSLP